MAHIKLIKENKVDLSMPKMKVEKVEEINALIKALQFTLLSKHMTDIGHQKWEVLVSLCHFS
ncbi:hypothetical protein M9H77_18937 [Catharanthus roseus]|uniref:Uncharacterized protein n=1 Tax=Catharanthus roseus TaxID=4058 RepID=A0ACC0B8Y1_CATRO|nr:hypothetical protein M9H77_18937 [Catharanthus roseus]